MPTEISYHPNPNPIPLIAFEHLSLSMVIWNSPSRPSQINVDQGRPKFCMYVSHFLTFLCFFSPHFDKTFAVSKKPVQQIEMSFVVVKRQNSLSVAQKRPFAWAFIWLENTFPIVCQLFEDEEYCSAQSLTPYTHCHRRQFWLITIPCQDQFIFI